MLAVPPQLQSNTAPLVGGLLILVLAAIAMALPPAPIATQEGTAGLGTLESPGLFSAGMAEQNAAGGYGFLALDVTHAKLEQNSLWRTELDLVAKRRFEVWGWVNLARATESPEKLFGALNFAGIYLFGPDAVMAAASLSGASAAKGRPVIPVVAKGALLPTDIECAVLVDLDTWLNSDGEIKHPILIADQLSEADVFEAIEHARELAGKDGKPKLVVARVPVR